MKIFNSENYQSRTMAIVLFLIILTIIRCSSSSYSKDDPVIINLKNVIKNEQEVPISRFVDELEYVPLQITPESIISDIRKIYVTKEYFIIWHTSPGTSNPILLFERKSGKFIREIGKRGRGPEEYLRPLECFYNPYNNVVYGRGDNFIKTYNLDGKFLTSFESPKVSELSSKSGYVYASIEGFMGSETFICYVNNSTGTINKRLIISNQKNEIKSFPHYEKWSTTSSGENFVQIIQHPIFFSWSNKISFKEKSNDTIFYVSSDRLIPRYVLYSGDSRYPYKLTKEDAINEFSKPKDYFETLNIFENSKYLFFDLVSRNKPFDNEPNSFKLIINFCIFDKTRNITHVCKNNEETTWSCLTDDINNLIPIKPISISDDNELISVIQAIEITKWKATNPDKALKLLPKIPWLNRINEFDNPVIVIAKLKN
jgi:hypothetical protein